MNGELLIRVGIVCIAAAVIATVVSLVLFQLQRKRLEKQLTIEYGPKDGKKRSHTEEKGAQE